MYNTDKQYNMDMQMHNMHNNMYMYVFKRPA